MKPSAIALLAALTLVVGGMKITAHDQMRHSDATLGVYGHVLGDSQRDAVDKVGEILRPSASKSETSGEYIQ